MTIHKRFEYCVVLDTLAVYDSAIPEARSKNIKTLEKLRAEALKLKEEDLGSEELQERFTELEERLWAEVGDLSRFVSAESAERPPGRECFPLE